MPIARSIALQRRAVTVVRRFAVTPDGIRVSRRTHHADKIVAGVPIPKFARFCGTL